MRWLSLLVGILFFCPDCVWSHELKRISMTQLSAHLPLGFKLSENQLLSMLNNEVISVSTVNNFSVPEKIQELNLMVHGISKNNCQKVSRKISRYENYQEYLNFIETSTYNSQTKLIEFVLNHTLLPVKMTLSFKFPRITGPGDYPFIFESGFLKNLQGTVYLRQLNKTCILSLKSYWKGVHTNIPNFIFETFTQTLSRIGLENLIRISQI